MKMFLGNVFRFVVGFVLQGFAVCMLFFLVPRFSYPYFTVVGLIAHIGIYLWITESAILDFLFSPFVDIRDMHC